jgi:hypothetical protein
MKQRERETETERERGSVRRMELITDEEVLICRTNLRQILLGTVQQGG